jgi:signal transduction histidine kinase
LTSLGISKLWYGILVSQQDESGRRDRGTSDQDLSEFLLRACHDLRSPIRAIKAHADLIRKSAPTPEIADFEKRLEFIIDGARKIDLLTDGLTSYSIALHVEQTSFQPARMDVILRMALARLDRELRAHGAEVTYGELPCVAGNPDRLAQVFENLLRNALRHGGRDSLRIHISAERQGETWLFAVRDNGTGIEAAYLERVFKPFERLRAGDSEGVGLGLAICRIIVERHGGKLWAESTPGTGSTFLFTLPAS